jgi:hypothetical protein
MAIKIDPKRELKQLYTAGREPELVDVPELSFLTIDGHGDPNRTPHYLAAIEALYAVAYAIKFAIKRDGGPGLHGRPAGGTVVDRGHDPLQHRTTSRAGRGR